MSNKIKEIRKSRNIKQKDIAEAVGVTRQTIATLEKGKYCNSIILAYKIAKYFNAKIEDVFDLRETPEDNKRPL